MFLGLDALLADLGSDAVAEHADRGQEGVAFCDPFGNKLPGDLHRMERVLPERQQVGIPCPKIIDSYTFLASLELISYVSVTSIMTFSVGSPT